MSVIVDAGLLAVGVVTLWGGARLLVTGASRLAGAAGVSALVVGLTVVAFGTSAPEIAVSVEAALVGRGNISIANVVGSNLFNLGVILGLVGVLAPFRVTETLVRRDALAMAAATAAAAVVLLNGAVSRLEGAILLALLGGYLGALGVTVRTDDGRPDAADDRATPHEIRPGLEGGRVLVGLLLVIGGGRVLIDSAVELALTVGISEWVVGATIVATGTSLPELVTSVVAVRRGDVGIAAGNVVGSNVFNALGVLGIVAVVRPTAVDPAVFVGLAWLCVLTAFATAVLATGRRLTRLEGVALVALGTSYWVVSVAL